MQRFAISIFTLLLIGCAATQQEVTSALQDRYTGHSVDNLVMQFGPPSNSFKMADGGSAYEWNIANHTNVDIGQYGGSENTLFCKFRAISGPDSLVRQVTTEDASNALGESLCAKKAENGAQGLMRSRSPLRFIEGGLRGNITNG